MGTTAKRIRRALVLGFTWAVAWAPIALAAGLLIIDPDNSMDEMWPVIGAYPGFLAGALFGAFLGITERRRAIRDLSVAHIAVSGAIAGVVVGTVPFLIGTPGPGVSVAVLAAWFISIVAVLSAASAVVSALFMRKSNNPAQRAVSPKMA